MPGEEPTEDLTPLRATIPDFDWFPCPHCGRQVKCPPVAMPVKADTTALLRRRERAPELDPGETTKKMD